MIRFANISDAKEIAELHVNSIRQTYVGIYPQKYFDCLSINEYIEMWTKYLLREDCRTVVYVVNEEIIGFGAICLYYTAKKVVVLDFLHVRQDCKRQGYGRKLVEAICSLLLSENLSEMEIGCIEGNHPARKFYQCLGAEYKGSVLSYNGMTTRFSNRLLLTKMEKICSKQVPTMMLNLDDQYNKLEQIVSGEYILWGAGEYYNCFMRQLNQGNQPSLIFDNNTEIQGLSINGVPVCKPHKTDLPVVIACSKYREVEKELCEMGCSRYVGFYPWHRYEFENCNEE